MKTAAALLFLAWCLPAAAEVDAPFGRFARPGVPVPLYSSDPGTVTVDGGWPAVLAGGEITTVFIPRVPCHIRDVSGAELVTLEGVPDDVFLVGVVGTLPDTAAKLIGDAVGRRALLQPLERDRLPTDWRAYDLFDLVIVAAAPARLRPGADKALVDWAHAGGRVAALGRTGAYYARAGGGLGWFGTDDSVNGLLRMVSEVLWEWRAPPAHPVAARPDLYAAFGLLQPEIVPGPLRAARLTFGGAALASALLLVLGLRFRFSRVSLALGLLVISLGGGLVGLLSRKEYQPWASGEIHVMAWGDMYERLQVYRMRTAVAGEPEWKLGKRETPLLSDAGEAPWWDEPGRSVRLRRGRWRIVLEETILWRDQSSKGSLWEIHEAWPGQRPVFSGGRWVQWQIGPGGRPTNGPSDPILRIRAAHQD